MSLNRKYILAGLIILITSCAPKRERVVFQITNNCSNGIVSQYVVRSTNDTIHINFLAPLQTYIISDLHLAANQNPNWYFDYPVYINYITNYSTGNAIYFNPNESGYWQFEDVGGDENFYTLNIVDTCF